MMPIENPFLAEEFGGEALKGWGSGCIERKDQLHGGWIEEAGK